MGARGAIWDHIQIHERSLCAESQKQQNLAEVSPGIIIARRVEKTRNKKLETKLLFMNCIQMGGNATFSSEAHQGPKLPALLRTKGLIMSLSLTDGPAIMTALLTYHQFDARRLEYANFRGCKELTFNHFQSYAILDVTNVVTPQNCQR